MTFDFLVGSRKTCKLFSCFLRSFGFARIRLSPMTCEISVSMICSSFTSFTKSPLEARPEQVRFLVEESYPTPHIHEQMTASNHGYDTAYNFTHNNIMLEPNAMNNMDTVAHMNMHNTQY